MIVVCICSKGVCGSQASSYSKSGFVIGTVACGSFLITVAVGISVVCFYKQKFSLRAHDDLMGYPMAKGKFFHSLIPPVSKSLD